MSFVACFFLLLFDSPFDSFSLSLCLGLCLMLPGLLSISLCLCSPFEMQWEGRSFGAFPGWAKANQESGGGKGVRVRLGAEVTVVRAPYNATTRNCQIWGFFLLSVPWFGLCYFPPQSKAPWWFYGPRL